MNYTVHYTMTVYIEKRSLELQIFFTISTQKFRKYSSQSPIFANAGVKKLTSEQACKLNTRGAQFSIFGGHHGDGLLICHEF